MKVEEEIKRLEEKQKVAFFQIEKRFAAIEKALEEFARKLYELESGKGKDKFIELEERVNDLEDLQMLTRLEIIKINESLKKSHLGLRPEEHPDISILNRRIDDLEKSVRDIESKISELKGIENLERIKEFEDVIKRVEEVDVSLLEKKLEEIKDEFTRFKSEMEESMSIMTSLIKKIVERIS
jgi:prefoldin subunit 5